MTPAAISHQVRALEEYCGVELFQRLTRSLRLTDTGRAALPALQEGFAHLTDAAQLLRTDQSRRVLTVSVAPSFAAKWLVPRLDKFRAAHPDYDIRIDATDRLASFFSDGVDVALRYGRGNYRGLCADRLTSDTVFPVCSPRLLEKGPPIREPADLRHHILLHVHGKMQNDLATWRMWLLAAGVEGVDPDRGPHFSADSMALEAASDGQGIVLASEALVESDLGNGRLMRLFSPLSCPRMSFCYFLVYPETRSDNPKVVAFRDWMLGEFKAQGANGSA